MYTNIVPSLFVVLFPFVHRQTQLSCTIHSDLCMRTTAHGSNRPLLFNHVCRNNCHLHDIKRGCWHVSWFLTWSVTMTVRHWPQMIWRRSSSKIWFSAKVQFTWKIWCNFEILYFYFLLKASTCLLGVSSCCCRDVPPNFRVQLCFWSDHNSGRRVNDNFLVILQENGLVPGALELCSPVLFAKESENVVRSTMSAGYSEVDQICMVVSRISLGVQVSRPLLWALMQT